MDRDLDRPGCNGDDQWRSHWIDCLVREQVLERQLVPHRHNPEDLVPVIKLCDTYTLTDEDEYSAEESVEDWESITLDELISMEPDTAEMVRRIVVSVEQFTSFRNFAWCPLGSLHRRLRDYDSGMSFQRAVEYLVAHGSADVSEYENPQSEYQTKGISIVTDNTLSHKILSERDEFIILLLKLYNRNMLVSTQSIAATLDENEWNLPLWFSIMETENVLNLLPGRSGQYSLFRTHHTVNLIAEREEL